MTAPVDRAEQGNGNQPRVGAVFDVGGALAIYWPDRHPCGATRVEPWLILHDYGGIEWAAELREGARLLDYLPGRRPTAPRPNSARARQWAEGMPQRLVQAAANVLPAAYDRSCGVPADLIARTTSDPEDWIPEAREVVAAVLRELTRADCPKTITALDIRFWANEAERSEP